MAETRRAGAILVPLDGSDLGAASLAVAGMLSRVTGAPIRLLHVAPHPHAILMDGTIVAYADQEAERLRAEAEDHLEQIKGRLTGLAVEQAVRFGEPATEIVAEARDSGAGLIAMSTHGRGGLARLAMGSVAERVVRTAPCPVVTVTAHAERQAVTAAAASASAGPPLPAVRRCLACARPSPVAFCQSCEARIRGQALEHKRGEDRAGLTGRAG